MPTPIKIGFSSCFLHADPQRAIFKGKTLLYLEEKLAHWVMTEGALGLLLPSTPPSGGITARDLIAAIDGLILQGGADVAPETYGETPLSPFWKGDAVRDAHEIALVKECLAQKKPIFGICRGAQLLNVALGGTLYQDIQTQVPDSLVHRDWDIYDQNFHEARIDNDSGLSKLYPGVRTFRINTVHHQAIKDLAKGLRAEALCTDDDIIEFVRYLGPSYAVAAQWHPEWHDPEDKTLLDGKPILREFLDEVRKARK